jgi:protein SDA1
MCHPAIAQRFISCRWMGLQDFCELVTFIAHLSGCYKTIAAPFPKQIIGLLSQHHAVLDSEVRQSLCRALILLRNKDLVESIECLEIFFQLFRCKDKILREMLFSYIVKDIKQMNQKHRQNHVRHVTLLAGGESHQPRTSCL